MKQELFKICDNLKSNIITVEEAHQQLIEVCGIIGKLSFKEIEVLVQLKHYDDSDYGNDDERCAALIEQTRNKVGYTKQDVKKYLTWE